MTSSAMKQHVSLATAPRGGLEVARGGGNKPPRPITGSQKNAATVRSVVTLDRRTRGLGRVPRHLGDVLDQLP
jgi:hypothetical protein